MTRLLREFAATIIAVLPVNWVAFLITLGYTQDDNGTSHTEPTTKIYKQLQVNAAQFHGDIDKWWEQFLRSLDSFGNADLTGKIHDGK